jgi:hypothetical protein
MVLHLSAIQLCSFALYSVCTILCHQLACSASPHPGSAGRTPQLCIVLSGQWCSGRCSCCSVLVQCCLVMHMS